MGTLQSDTSGANQKPRRADTGGPAFPRPASEYTKNGTLPDGNDAIADQDGMTLRDYFAAQVVASLVPLLAVAEVPQADMLIVASRRAYQFADAMLAARSKPPST